MENGSIKELLLPGMTNLNDLPYIRLLYHFLSELFFLIQKFLSDTTLSKTFEVRILISESISVLTNVSLNSRLTVQYKRYTPYPRVSEIIEEILLKSFILELQTLESVTSAQFKIFSRY